MVWLPWLSQDLLCRRRRSPVPSSICQELAGIDKKTANAVGQLEALNTATEKVRKEQAELNAVIAQKRRQISQEAQAFVRLAQGTVTNLKQQLGDGVREAVGEVQMLRDKSLEVGRELGRYQSFIQSNEWLRELLDLTRGEEAISGNQVRVIGMTVLHSMKAWVSQHQDKLGPLSQLKARIDAVIEELERWPT